MWPCGKWQQVSGIVKHNIGQQAYGSKRDEGSFVMFFAKHVVESSELEKKESKTIKLPLSVERIEHAYLRLR